jgi:hypothetical protein
MRRVASRREWTLALLRSAGGVTAERRWHCFAPPGGVAMALLRSARRSRSAARALRERARLQRGDHGARGVR